MTKAYMRGVLILVLRFVALSEVRVINGDWYHCEGRPMSFLQCKLWCGGIFNIFRWLVNVDASRSQEHELRVSVVSRFGESIMIRMMLHS